MSSHLLKRCAQLLLLTRMCIECLNVLRVGKQLALVVHLSLLQQVRAYTDVALHLLYAFLRR